MRHFLIGWLRSSMMPVLLIALMFTAFAQDAPSLVKLNRGFETGALQSMFSLLWSPDGHLVVQGGRDLRVFDTSGRLLWKLENPSANAGVAISPNGQWLVSNRTSDKDVNNSWLGVYRMSDGLKVLARKIGVYPLRVELAWSPDGKWIAKNAGHDVTFFHAGTLEPDSVLNPLCRYVMGFGWRPGTSELALGCEDGSVELNKLSGTEFDFFGNKVLGKHRRWIHTPADRHNGNGRLAWSPDGTQIAFLWDDSVTLLDPEGKPTLEFTVDPERLGLTDAIAWSPDASSLAVTGGYNQSIMLHDAKTGRHLLDLGPRQYNPEVMFSPDARFLIGISEEPSSVFEKPRFLSVWGSADGSPVFDAAHWR